MSWPGFFSLSSAWLATLFVPLVIFYFLKLKRPRQRVSSLLLWYQVVNDQRVNSPFQKFKRNLLLLLQILLLACLVLAAMQPYLRSASTAGTVSTRADRLLGQHGGARSTGRHHAHGGREETSRDADRQSSSRPASRHDRLSLNGPAAHRLHRQQADPEGSPRQTGSLARA